MKFLENMFEYTQRRKYFQSLKSPTKILDLGCGSGHNSIAIRKMYPELEVHGVDIISNSTLPKSIIFHQVNLNDGILPFPDNYFDAIIYTHVIEHLQNPLIIGKEIGRILKGGGSIYVETPNWTSMLVPSFGLSRDQHNPFNFFDDPTHVKPWSKHGLYEFLLQSCKLTSIRVGTVRNWIRLLFDIPIIILGSLSGKRGLVISSVWNIWGWCIYGIAYKPNEVTEKRIDNAN